MHQNLFTSSLKVKVEAAWSISMSDMSAFYDSTHFQSWHQQSENSYFWCRFDINNLTCHFLMTEYSFQIFPGCMSSITFLLAISALFLKIKSFHFNFQHSFFTQMWRKQWKCLYVGKWKEKVNMFRQTTWKQVDWIGYGNQIRPSTRFETCAFPFRVFSTLDRFLCCSDTALSTGAHVFTIHIIQLLRFP